MLPIQFRLFRLPSDSQQTTALISCPGVVLVMVGLQKLYISICFRIFVLHRRDKSLAMQLKAVSSTVPGFSVAVLQIPQRLHKVSRL